MADAVQQVRMPDHQRQAGMLWDGSLAIGPQCTRMETAVMRTGIFLISIIQILSSPVWSASARVQPTEAYGVDLLVIENDFLVVTINPQKGGRVADILDKRTDKHLTGGKDVYFGCCKELVHDDQLPGELMQAAHRGRIVERGPKVASVVTEYLGRTVRTNGVELVKTFRLVEGEPFLRLNYRLRTRYVGADNMALRIHNVFSPGGKFEPESARAFIPIPAGPRAAVWNKFYRQYTGGWSAVVREETSEGVVCLFDWNKMYQGFNWNVPSIEWYYRPVRLKPGLVWSDEVIIGPTAGLGQIDHADRTAVWQTSFDGGHVTIRFYAFVNGDAMLQPTVLGSDGKTVHAAAGRTTKLEAGKVASVTWEVPDGTTLKQSTLKVAVTVGKTTASFLANPAGVKTFSLPVPERKPVALDEEPIKRIQIARPLDGPEIRGSQPVKSTDTGWERLEGEKRPKSHPPPAEIDQRQVTLDSGSASYGLYYPCVRDDKDKPWRPFGEWGSGLGLADPATGNFYRGGFFDLEINGVRLRSAVPDIRLVRGTGKAAVDFRWDIATATVHVRFTALGGDGALYSEVDISPKGQLKTVIARFIAFPGGFHGERDRRFRTIKGESGHGKPLKFGPDMGWLLLADRLKNPGTGAVALAFPPEQIQDVEVKAPSNYGVTTTVTWKPSLRRLNFVLWTMFRSTNQRALERIQAEHGPAMAKLKTPDRLFTVGREVARPKPKPEGIRVRVLELATFAHGESRWGHRHFEELERSEYLYTHKYGQPTRYEEFLRRTVESSRYAFRAGDQFRYFLRNRKDVQVHRAYRNVFSDYLAKLYDYDFVVLNDFPLDLLDPYERDLQAYVRSGRGLVFMGGYGAYGGMGKGYGSWKGAAITSLLPVNIESVPDFVEQTDYRQGLWSQKMQGRTRECAYPDYRITIGNGFQRFGPILPIMHSLDWLGRGNQVVPVHDNHPILAGVPVEQLSPSYHRVTVRGAATTIARIGHDPVLVVDAIGKGRVAALTFSDARRLWVWRHTSQLFSQLADWAAGAPPKPMVRRTNVGAWGRAVGVELDNPTAKTIESDLIVTQVGAGGRRVGRTLTPAIPARSSRRFHLDFEDAPRFASGEVKVVASWSGHTATTYFRDPPSSAAPELGIDDEHKRNVLRRETISPRVIVGQRVPGGSTVVAQLIGEDGRAVRSSETLASGASDGGLRLPIPAKRLAYGNYAYRVSLKNANEKELAATAIRIKVCRLVIPEYPILWYGYGAHSQGDLDCYMTLGLIERFKEQANSVFSIRGWGAHNVEEICDRSLGLGIPLFNYCFYSPAVRGDDPKFGRSPHHESRLNALRAKGLAQAPYAKHPAIHWFYIDDEGTGFSETDYDKEQYEKTAGRKWPAEFKSVEDHHSVARFHIRGGNNVWKAAFDGLREALPDRTHFFLQSVGNVAANGGWIWDNFRDSDINCIDLYPPAPVDYGQCLFYYNAMRCLGYYNGKPGWILLGEYRETFEMMRSQWWLMLGSGLESYGWYGANYGGGPHGIGADRIHRIAPYDRLAMRYSSLLARWDKPRSRVAIYWSLASCARRGEDEGRKTIRIYGREVEKACQAAAVELYRHDLYPDVITEAEILAGKHDQYDAIILPGVTWDTRPVVQKLTAYAKSHPLMLAKSSTIKLPGAAPFDAAALSKKYPPEIETPDPMVHAEPLTAGAQRYVMVYNHQDKNVDASVLIRQPQTTVAYDVFSHAFIKVASQNGASVMKVRLGAYDGRLLALCPAALPDIKVEVRDGTCGSDISAQILAGLPSKNGVVPVEVAVLDPRGSKTDYGGSFAVTGGRSTYVIASGENEQTGRWTVSAKDLITGKIASATFQLTPKQ